MINSSNPGKDSNRAFRNKKQSIVPKPKIKDQTGKRQKIVLSITAGHIRGGHSYH